eukprot:GHVH01017016.1.p1 GENE.GHVH01017016.1~~GHVH01017016.1.p1  ORF type:complete len:1166 (+),score=221.73 GHVH01017016.1:92-3589(+)
MPPPRPPQSKVVATGRGFEAVEAELHAAKRKAAKEKNLTRKVAQLETKHKEKDFVKMLLTRQKESSKVMAAGRCAKAQSEGRVREQKLLVKEQKIAKAEEHRKQRSLGVAEAAKSLLESPQLPKVLLPKPSNLERVPHQLEEIIPDSPDTVPPSSWCRPVDDHFTRAKKLLPVLKRPIAIEISRLSLPAMEHVDEVVSKVLARDVVIIGGSTGSGKSTQVPQMLLEGGFCWHGYVESLPEDERRSLKSNRGHFQIGCTQPRKVAVTALHSRVGVELGVPELVGYQVRHDSSTLSDESCIKFMTDGILMKELQSDFSLANYSCVIMDEAHERGVNGDLLLGLLTRSVALRRRDWERGGLLPPLKFLIMSATLDIASLVKETKLFDLLDAPPPTVEFSGRTFPVVVHFSKVTPGANELSPKVSKEALLNATAKKVFQIHKQLPAGTVLVFLSGRDEVDALCSKIEKTSSRLEEVGLREEVEEIDFEEIAAGLCGEKGTREDVDQGNLYEMEDVVNPETGEVTGRKMVLADDPAGHAVLLDGDPWSSAGLPSKGLQTVDQLTIEQWARLGGFEGAAEQKEAQEGLMPDREGGSRWLGGDGASRVRTIPLYGALSPEDQDLAFLPPSSPDERIVVVATNVAETSLTIPNCRYVVDSGKHKTRRYEPTGLSRFQVEWISQASADQRAGRAGRVGPGHCYRLYSSSVYSLRFEEHAPVAMLEVPLDSVVLYLASLRINEYMDFPYPSPPKREAIGQAVKDLTMLGALGEDSGGITPVGDLMSRFPLPPRVARSAVHFLSLSDTMFLNKKKASISSYPMPLKMGVALTVGCVLLAAWSLGGSRMIVDHWAREKMEHQVNLAVKKSTPQARDDFDGESGGKTPEIAEHLARSVRCESYVYSWRKSRDDVDVCRQIVLGLGMYADQVETYIDDEFIVRKRLMEVLELSLQIRDVITSVLKQKWMGLKAPWKASRGRLMKSPFGITERDLEQSSTSQENWNELINSLYPFGMISNKIETGRKRSRVEPSRFIQGLVEQFSKVDEVDVMIKQSLLAGFLDHVSSLKLAANKLAGASSLQKNAFKSIQYPLDNVFIHTNSQMARTRPRPAFVCYLQLLQQSKKMKGVEGVQITYMTDVFALDRELLEFLQVKVMKSRTLADMYKYIGLINEEGKWAL